VQVRGELFDDRLRDEDSLAVSHLLVGVVLLGVGEDEHPGRGSYQENPLVEGVAEEGPRRIPREKVDRLVESLAILDTDAISPERSAERLHHQREQPLLGLTFDYDDERRVRREAVRREDLLQVAAAGGKSLCSDRIALAVIGDLHVFGHLDDAHHDLRRDP